MKITALLLRNKTGLHAKWPRLPQSLRLLRNDKLVHFIWIQAAALSVKFATTTILIAQGCNNGRQHKTSCHCEEERRGNLQLFSNSSTGNYLQKILTVLIIGLLGSIVSAATADDTCWTIRFIEPSSAKLFKPVIHEDSIKIMSLGGKVEQRKGHPEYVSIHYHLPDAISSLSFDYNQTGDASRMPMRLLDVTGRELWSYDGQGEAPRTVTLDALQVRGLLIFRVSRKGSKTLPTGWSHTISNLSFTKHISEQQRDEQGFILLDSLDSLRAYANNDNQKLRLRPGLYKLNTAFFRHFIELTGHDNHWDLTGVTISASLELFRQFGWERGDSGFYCVLNIKGDRNRVEGLSIQNHGEGYSMYSRNKLLNICGRDCIVRNVTVTPSGSNPWGYGSLFGIGGGIIRKMNGIRIGDPARNTQLIGCRVHMRAMGHAIFVQGAQNTLIEDCHVDGLLRPTNEILAETSGLAFERGFKVPGYGEGVQIGPDRLIPPNEIVSLSEDGIRMYSSRNDVGTGSTTIRNCTVTKMRRGICTGLSKAGDQVINCEVTDCIAAGYNIGSNERLVNCRADAKYAEALCSPYRDSHGAQIDLKILDSRQKMANNLLVKVNGSQHDINLHTADPKFVPKDMTIELASSKGYGSFRKGERKATRVTLKNQTPAHVWLFQGAIENKIQSQGPVTDLGQNNVIKREQ